MFPASLILFKKCIHEINFVTVTKSKGKICYWYVMSFKKELRLMGAEYNKVIIVNLGLWYYQKT